MEEKETNKMKLIKSFSTATTPSNYINKIRFNYNTINSKTPKNINNNINTFSFYSQRANTINYKTFDETNIKSMNRILSKITTLNNKLDRIKIKRKRNLKLININQPKPKIICKTE